MFRLVLLTWEEAMTWFTWFCRTPARSQRPRGFKPTLEGLEDRLAQSAASAASAAVAAPSLALAGHFSGRQAGGPQAVTPNVAGRPQAELPGKSDRTQAQEAAMARAEAAPGGLLDGDIRWIEEEEREREAFRRRLSFGS